MRNKITYQKHRRRKRSKVGAPLFWTPAMIADYMRRTNSMVDALNGDYEDAKRGGHLPGALESSWVAFRRDWKSFFGSNKASWSGGTVDRAEDYRLQLTKWRSELARHHKPQSPAPHIERQPGSSFFQGAGSGALLVLGAIVVYMLTRNRGQT